MAYTQNGTWFDEKLYYELKPNVISRRSKPRPTYEDFSLNFRINTLVMRKFSGYCIDKKLKKSNVLKRLIHDTAYKDLELKKFEKYNDPKLKNDCNVHIKINKQLYDDFVEKCAEKGYKEVSEVLRSFIVFIYTESYEEVLKVYKKRSKKSEEVL